MAYRKAELSRRPNGQYQRVIGKAPNRRGELAPRRFLLGTDRRLAERANLLLEQLWEQVVEDFERQRRETLASWDTLHALGEQLYAPPPAPRPLSREEIEREPPHWQDDTLALAEACRKGLTRAVISQSPRESAHAYAERLEELGRRFPGYTFAPTEADRPTLEIGRRVHEVTAERLHEQLQESTRVARVRLPSPGGGTLYQALDAYAAWAPQHNRKEHGRKEAEAALRLKDATPDMDLGELGYSALERIAAYWAARPEARRRGGWGAGRPISLETVSRQLKTARRFANWLNRTDRFDWELPRHGLDALKVNLNALRTPGEMAARRTGVQVFSLEQLQAIYQHGSDFDRLLVLLGLNAGFAQAEAAGLRWDEIEDGTIRRIRHKSGVYGEFALWPETLAALAWWKRLRGGRSDLVLLTERGNSYPRQRLANQWAKCRGRVERGTGGAAGWWLSFKHLRKTAAQLVRRASDGEVAAVFLCHGQPVASDELSDVYSNRPFDRVAAALAEVRTQLAPVMAAAPAAFTSTHTGGRGPRPDKPKAGQKRPGPSRSARSE